MCVTSMGYLFQLKKFGSMLKFSLQNVDTLISQFILVQDQPVQGKLFREGIDMANKDDEVR